MVSSIKQVPSVDSEKQPLCSTPLIPLTTSDVVGKRSSASLIHHNHAHHQQHHKTTLQSVVRLALGVAGIYFFFLTWGYLQERISTIPYERVSSDLTLPPSLSSNTSKFKYFLVLNTVQACVASALAWIFHAILHSTHPRLSCFKLLSKNRSLTMLCFRICTCASLASPLGYASLKHISYPTMTLGKSCKLVPVMLVSVLLHGKRYGWSKYALVGLITIGVSMFMLWDTSKQHKSEQSNAQDSLLGVGLLFANLFLDGLLYGWQDELFARYRLSSHQVMYLVNLLSCVLLSLCLLVQAIFAPNSEIVACLCFLHRYPRAILDMLAFSLCGSCGQLFVFYIMEHFGSLALVTINVTRKLATMCISLVLFGHAVCWQQLLGIGLVFGALVIDAWQHSHHKK